MTIRNMADMYREVHGIDLSLLIPQERAELAGSMLTAGRVNQSLEATATTYTWMEANGDVRTIHEREARADLAGTCIQVFNALEALNR